MGEDIDERQKEIGELMAKVILPKDRARNWSHYLAPTFCDT
tara:strand:+ start:757 stop:879 length:123 start_codon:yes stop_codon:yes gene_type:complete